MSPELALQWAGIAGLAVAIPAGLFGFVAPIMNWLRKSVFGPAGFAIAALGVVLITSPKWTEVVIKVGTWETRISQLEQRRDELTAQVHSTRLQLANAQAQLASAWANGALAFSDTAKPLDANWWKSDNDASKNLATFTATELAGLSPGPPDYTQGAPGMQKWFSDLGMKGVSFLASDPGQGVTYLQPADAAAKLEQNLNPDPVAKISSYDSADKERLITDIVKDLGKNGILVAPPTYNAKR